MKRERVELGGEGREGWRRKGEKNERPSRDEDFPQAHLNTPPCSQQPLTCPWEKITLSPFPFPISCLSSHFSHPFKGTGPCSPAIILGTVPSLALPSPTPLVSLFPFAVGQPSWSIAPSVPTSLHSYLCHPSLSHSNNCSQNLPLEMLLDSAFLSQKSELGIPPSFLI